MATGTMKVAVVNAVNQRLQSIQQRASLFCDLLERPTPRLLDKASIDFTSGTPRSAVPAKSLDDPNTTEAGEFTNWEFPFACFSERTPLHRETIAFKREIGRQTDESMASAAEIVTQVAAIQVGKIDRGTEKLCRDAILNATATFAGQTLDYDRDSTLTVTLTGDNRWTQTGADISGDLADLCDEIVLKTGGATMPTRAIFGGNAIRYFFADDLIKAQLDQLHARSDVSNRRYSPEASGAIYHGDITVGQYRLNCYSYPAVHNNAGTTEQYMPADKVLITGDRIFGGQLLYGGVPVISPTGDIAGGIAGALLPGAGIDYILSPWVSQLASDVNRQSLILRTESRVIPAIPKCAIDGTGVLDVA